MGADGYGWVRCGIGAQADTKTRQAYRKMVMQDTIWALWPGKFPRSSCFGVFDKKWCVWVQVGFISILMGEHGCIDQEGSKNKTKTAPNGRTADVL